MYVKEVINETMQNLRYTPVKEQINYFCLLQCILRKWQSVNTSSFWQYRHKNQTMTETTSFGKELVQSTHVYSDNSNKNYCNWEYSTKNESIC